MSCGYTRMEGVVVRSTAVVKVLSRLMRLSSKIIHWSGHCMDQKVICQWRGGAAGKLK